MPNPYESGVLDKEVHARLVQDIENISRDAGILPRWLWTSTETDVPPKLIAWLKNFRTHADEGISGLAVIAPKLDLEKEFASMTAALLRNFIRARVSTLHQLLDHPLDSSEIRALFIPNFFVGQQYGGNLPGWKISILQDVLLNRHLDGHSTIVLVSDMGALAEQYGIAIANHVKNNFTIINL